jgi:soluble lytic murein transglycosylase
MGLMQVHPKTAKELQFRNPFDPEENIDKCTGYLAGFFRKYRSIDMALMAYNRGEKGAADEIAGGTKPHKDPYVRSVISEWRKYQNQG